MFAPQDAAQFREFCCVVFPAPCGHPIETNACSRSNSCPASIQRLAFYRRHLSSQVARSIACPSFLLTAEGNGWNVFIGAAAQFVDNIRTNPFIKRSEMETVLLDHIAPYHDSLQKRCDDILELLISCICMCGMGSPQARSMNLLEDGRMTKSWTDESFANFISKAFPVVNTQDTEYDSFQTKGIYESRLTVANIQHKTGLQVKMTSDLRLHLRIDRTQKTFTVFSNVAFLKYQLYCSKYTSPRKANERCLSGLPRDLLIETLDTLQKILFNTSDKKSAKLAKSLCQERLLDPEWDRWDASSYLHDSERNRSYKYWEARLSELLAEVQDPQPRTTVGKWAEAHVAPRYMVLATFIGVIFAVILGMLSLAVSAYQAWVTYQAWQHPISGANG